MLGDYLKQNQTMIRKTPKGKTPSLISGKNGKPKLITVAKASSVTDCARCDHLFQTGDECFEIPQMGKAYAYAIRVCKDCFKSILSQTQSDLNELIKILSK